MWQKMVAGILCFMVSQTFDSGQSRKSKKRSAAAPIYWVPSSARPHARWDGHLVFIRLAQQVSPVLLSRGGNKGLGGSGDFPEAGQLKELAVTLRVVCVLHPCVSCSS